MKTTSTYDSFGQRAKYVTGTSSQTTTYYPSKGYNITGSTPTKHIFLPNGTMIATIVGTGTSTTVSYIHTEHLGGIGVATNDSAEVAQLVDTYPYGTLRLDEQSGLSEQRKGISGHEYDTDTGLTYANARYYNGGSGRFVSQDPMFWETPEEYIEDPQQWNSYSYARNNPLNFVDLLGMFIIETGKVELSDSWDSITTAINQAYGVNYSIDTVKSLNNNPSWIYEGQTLVPNNKVPDITNKLNSIMIEHSSDIRINNPWWFRDAVKKGGVWDLKNTEEFNSDKYLDGFVYSGNRIRYDAPGNIHYGFVGSGAFWSWSKLLLKEAGKAQIAEGKSKTEWKKDYYGDDPTDQYFIKLGISLFYKLW